jgi:hypothetical protein
VPAGASERKNDSAANRASRQARNGLAQDHSIITQGVRNGRRWGSERDTHETKDDAARFKHPGSLSSHIAYYVQCAQAGAIIRTLAERATFASTIVPNRPAKVRWDEGARLGSNHCARLPKQSTGASAGSLTDQTLAPLLLPSSSSGHSQPANLESPLQAIRALPLVLQPCTWRQPLAKRARDDVTTILLAVISRHRARSRIVLQRAPCCATVLHLNLRDAAAPDSQPEQSHALHRRSRRRVEALLHSAPSPHLCSTASSLG